MAGPMTGPMAGPQDGGEGRWAAKSRFLWLGSGLEELRLCSEISLLLFSVGDVAPQFIDPTGRRAVPRSVQCAVEILDAQRRTPCAPRDSHRPACSDQNLSSREYIAEAPRVEIRYSREGEGEGALCRHPLHNASLGVR